MAEKKTYDMDERDKTIGPAGVRMTDTMEKMFTSLLGGAERMAAIVIARDGCSREQADDLVTLCLLSGTMAHAAAAAHGLGKEFDAEAFIEFAAHAVRSTQDAIPTLAMAQKIYPPNNGGKP